MKRLDRSARARPPGARAAPPAPVSREAELEIREIGVRGDAVADGPSGPIYVPYALPGERVRARVAGDRAAVLALERESADRIAPICAHFGTCGGCALQHWSETQTLEWKRLQVVRALERRGIAVEVAPILPAWGEGRRRAALHAVKAGRGIRFGYSVRGGGGVAAIGACPVLAPAFEAALPRLRKLGEALIPARGELTLPTLLTETGLDVDVKGAGGLSGADRERLERLAALAESLDFARLSLDGEVAIERRRPLLQLGLARLTPPPGAFTQPTLAGEAILQRLTLSALEGAERALDLFAGLGTFALPLAERCEVHAVEGDHAMLRALKEGADAAGGALKSVSIERRDLLRAPVSALEMKRFDAVVFDPPRSGARLQAEQIARSKASRVAAVSCDAATFARDVKVLIEHGFRLERVTPVDQFRFSPHVEIVGALAR